MWKEPDRHRSQIANESPLQEVAGRFGVVRGQLDPGQLEQRSPSHPTVVPQFPRDLPRGIEIPPGKRDRRFHHPQVGLVRDFGGGAAIQVPGTLDVAGGQGGVDLESVRRRNVVRVFRESALPAADGGALLQAAGVGHDPGQPDGGEGFLGIDLQHPPHMALGPGHIALAELLHRDVDQGGGEARVHLDRLGQGGVGSSPVAGEPEHQGLGLVALGQLGVQLDGPLRGLEPRARVLPRIFADSELQHLAVGVGDPRPGQGVVRVHPDRLPEESQGVSHPLGGVLAVLFAPLQVQVVGPHVLGAVLGELPRFRRGERHPERLGDGRGDLLLHREDVLQDAVVAVGPEMEPVGAVDELGGNADAVAGLADAPLQHRPHPQVRGHPGDVHGFAAVLGHRVAGRHPESLDLGEIGEDVLGDPRAEVLALLVGGEVLEVEHGQRRPVGGGGPAHLGRGHFQGDGGQLPPQVADVAGPLHRVLGEAAAEERAEAGGRGGGNRAPVRLPLQDLGDDVGNRLAREGRPAGETFVEDAPERPHVGPPVHRFPAGLFRAHVGGGSQDQPRAGGEGGRGGGGGQDRRGVVAGRLPLGQTEVQHLHRSCGGEHDVSGLQVPVDDAALVGGLQGVGDLPADLDGLGHRERSPGERLGQGLALHQLQHQMGGARVVLQPVDGGDVGMVQRGQDLGLAFESGQVSGVVGESVREGLDGHGAVEAGVAGAVDLAHSARPQGVQDLVGAEAGSGFEGHGFRVLLRAFGFWGGPAPAGGPLCATHTSSADGRGIITCRRRIGRPAPQSAVRFIFCKATR